jgi:hypothetical protein
MHSKLRCSFRSPVNRRPIGAIAIGQTAAKKVTEAIGLTGALTGGARKGGSHHLSHPRHQLKRIHESWRQSRKRKGSE